MRLEQALEWLRAEGAASSGEAESLAARAERELAAAAASHESLAQHRRENELYAKRIELCRGALPWPWIAGALVVALAGGAFWGWLVARRLDPTPLRRPQVC